MKKGLDPPYIASNQKGMQLYKRAREELYTTFSPHY